MRGSVVRSQTLFVLNHYVSARDDAVFADADQFIPERWLRGAGDTDVTVTPSSTSSSISSSSSTCPDDVKQRSAFGCLPFGYGNRSCLGQFMDISWPKFFTEA